MIDIQDDVYTLVSNAVHATFPDAFVISREIRTPSKFPCVSIVESDNAALTYTQDSNSNENHVSVMYTLDVYSNKQKGSMAECRAIMALADTALIRKGFTRITKQAVSFDDATKYRLVARYTAVVSTDKTIYRR